MPIPFLLSLLILLLAGSCSPPAERNEQTTHPSETPGIDLPQDSLVNRYTPDAIKITPAGEVISGAAAIVHTYREQPLRIDSTYILQAIPADREHRFVYEIGGFVTPSGEYRHLLIRDTEGDTTRRVLEMVAPVRTVSSARAAIDRRRAEWIERCNEHDARTLIENLYAPNTVYYNHRPPLVGRAALIEAYAYMNNPDYQLHLEPLAFSMVNDELAFEIGQCSGSYGGKYIIAWQRDAAGEWYVLLDSNI